MKLEYPKETGVYDAPNQFVPTETSINPANGDIYVTDGCILDVNFINVRTLDDAKIGLITNILD